MKIKVSDYIAKFLVSKNIKNCFMVTGGGAMHLNDSIGHCKKINCIFNHHEQGSSIAAEGFSRYSGEIACVCVTSGPGGINALNGVMGAFVDSIPMFILSGQVKYQTTIHIAKNLKLRQLGDQEFDITHSVENMTKYAKLVSNPKNIAYELEKAYFIAMSGRRGPVWLDIPIDVQAAVVDESELKHFSKIEKEKNKKYDYKKILKLIYDAKSPLILAGTGIRLAGAEKEFLKLVDTLSIPVAVAWNANDIIGFDNVYFAGLGGTVGTRAGNFSISNCDLLLSLGCRMNIRMIGYNKFEFAKTAKKIVVDIDSAELKKPTIKVDIPINMDVKDFIRDLLKEKYEKNKKHIEWVNWCRGNVKRFEVVRDEFRDKDYKNDFINPYVFLEKLFENLTDRDRIICGNGSACVMTLQASKIKYGQRLFTNSGCASMGYAVPASIGVATYDNSFRTICIDGDGSFMMNMQELATIYQNKLNIKIFILNNGGYHSIRQTQENLFKPPLVGVDEATGISFPDFSILAKAFKFDYFCINSEKMADEIIKNVIVGSSPTICEVIVDKKQNFEPKVMSKKDKNGKLISTALDDMFPYLDRSEYNEIKYKSKS